YNVFTEVEISFPAGMTSLITGVFDKPKPLNYGDSLELIQGARALLLHDLATSTFSQLLSRPLQENVRMTDSDPSSNSSIQSEKTPRHFIFSDEHIAKSEAGILALSKHTHLQ